MALHTIAQSLPEELVESFSQATGRSTSAVRTVISLYILARGFPSFDENYAGRDESYGFEMDAPEGDPSGYSVVGGSPIDEQPHDPRTAGFSLSDIIHEE